MDLSAVRRVLQSALQAHTFTDHHVDSYDDFLDVHLPAIVAEAPHKVMEVNKQQHRFQFGRVSYVPAVLMEADGVLRRVTPDECRVRALDYTVTVLVTITHTVHPCDGDDDQVLERHIFHDVKLCHLPLMVGSRRCVTRATGECLETPGLFIVGGNDKTIVPQEKMRINVPCVFKAVGHGGKYQLTCEVRAWTEQKIRTTSTMNLFVTPDASGQMPHVHAVIPYSKHGLVPLRVMFMLLGCTDVADMEACILPVNDDASVLHAELRVRVRHVLHNVPTEVPTLAGSALLRWVITRGGDAGARGARLDAAMVELTGLVDKEVLPHLTSPLHKWYYLGMMARKLLLTQICKNPQFSGLKGTDPLFRGKDNRDDFRFKAIETPGMLMALLFRRHFRSFKDKLARQYKATAEKKRVMLNDLVGLYSDISQSTRAAFTSGVWQVKPQKAGSGHGNGVVQMVSRINVAAVFSHLRKVNAPLNKDGKLAKPRLLDASHYGKLGPCHTPEGAPCGLNKHLAMMAHVRIGYPAESAYDPIRGLSNFVPLTQLAHGVDMSPVYVNGILLGLLRHPQAAVEELRRLRRRADMAFDVTIYHDVAQREVHVNTDSGVLLWPVVRASCLGVMRDVLRTYPGTAGVWGQLLALGVVEYVDNLEEDNCVVAEDMRALSEAPAGTYTHVALHGTMMLSARTALIPFSNYNQSPRNVYAAGMMKQAISTANEGPTRRLDTLSYELDTVQAPLVRTLMSDLLSPDQTNIGQNVVCAIMCSGGFNQEDSIIVNKSAIERGLLRVTAYRTYRESEKPSSNDYTCFENPSGRDCVGARYADYTTIETDGLPTPGVRVTPESVIIGKTVTSNPVAGSTHVVRDHSVVARHHEDMVVDSVVTATGQEGNHLVRVVLRTSRLPEVGDKLSSRHSQKGVIGAVTPQEDLPFSATTGMTPDIIINPHCMPSRMSIGHLMEALASKVAAVEGVAVDGTPFEGDGYADGECLIADFGRRLLAAGHASSGMERLIDGTTGEMLDAAVFMCPTYYLRLKHMVTDKLHARSRGPMQILTRQPAGGRSKDGGLRIGEMERDCIVAHGAANFLLDRLLYASDYYVAHVCGKCGGLAQDDNAAVDDATLRQTGLQLVKGGKYCRKCRSDAHVHAVETPYAFTPLLYQELQAMHVGFKFEVKQ